MPVDGARWVWRTFAAVSLLALTLPLSFAGGLKRSDAEVKVTAAASRPDASGKQTVNIQLVINKGWHVYANPIDNDQFTTLQTQVAITAQGKPADAKVVYPQGVLHQDKVVGDYKVYENKVNILAAVQRAAGDASPLEISVRFNACNNKGQCLPPGTVKLTVPAQ